VYYKEGTGREQSERKEAEKRRVGLKIVRAKEHEEQERTFGVEDRATNKEESSLHVLLFINSSTPPLSKIKRREKREILFSVFFGIQRRHSQSKEENPTRRLGKKRVCGGQQRNTRR
jgi:hypothetical protein